MSTDRNDHETPRDPKQLNTLDLQSLIVSLLGNHLRSLSIDVSEQGIVLRGSCKTFHTKQMVQEIVRKNSSLRIISNTLIVDEVTPIDVPLAFQHVVYEDERRSSPKTDADANVVHEDAQSASPQFPAVRVKKSSSRFNSVFLPTDFSVASQFAYFHALKIALENHAILHVMHVDSEQQVTWDDFPNVGETLVKWQVLPEGSGKAEVEDLGLLVNRSISSSGDPVKACSDYVAVNDVDLIVLSVHQRDGMMRWLGSIDGERASTGSSQATLFVPASTGFVSHADGGLKLQRILVPIVKKPRPGPAIDFVRVLTSCLNVQHVDLTLLHVGTVESMPVVERSHDQGWNWREICLDGDRAETILKYAKEIDANLIVMATDGPDRFLDGFLGTTSERVLRKSSCPVAVLPVV